MLSTGQVIVVQLLAGAASVLFMTAYQVYLPAVVTPGELVEGNTKMRAGCCSAPLPPSRSRCSSRSPGRARG
jgi:hypothetical protein